MSLEDNIVDLVKMQNIFNYRLTNYMVYSLPFMDWRAGVR